MPKEQVRSYRRRDGTMVSGYRREKRKKGKKIKKAVFNYKRRQRYVDEYGVIRSRPKRRK